MRKAVVAYLFVLAWVPRLASAQVLEGVEFQVNTYTTATQVDAAVAVQADGSFVVAWASNSQDGSNEGVFARRWDAVGTPGPEVRVNTYVTNSQHSPAVARAGSGFVVVWSSFLQDGSQEGVFGQLYDASLAPLGTEFRVNTYTTNFQNNAAVSASPGGGFVVAFHGGAPGLLDVFARRYDASGAPLGGEFRVNTYTTSYQGGPSIATDASGNFVVVWTSLGQDGNLAGVFGQRFSAAGSPLGAEFAVNTYTTSAQGSHSVAVDSAGRFVVAWSSAYEDGSQHAIVARRYDAAGVPSPPFQVNVFTTNAQLHPAVALDDSGTFVVAWDSQGPYSNSTGVFARVFDGGGAPLTGDFRINSYTTYTQQEPAIARDPNGGFVVAWESQNQDGQQYGIFGQRLGVDLIFRDGFASGGMSAWSSASIDGGDLGVSAAAALNGTAFGLQGLVNDTAGLYVQDDSPQNENRYRARFYFDPNGFDPGEAQNHLRTRIFIAFEEGPTRRLAAVVLRRQAGAYSLMGRARLDDNSQQNTGFFPITDDPHFVEIDWKRSSGPDALDGSFELFLDGVSLSSQANLDNSISAVDFARLGALSVKPGASGTMYWDEFESRRVNYIGP